MILKITYMSGAGNLFTVFDNREIKISVEELSRIAPTLCNSKVDDNFITEGLIALQSGEYDFTAEFFNPDGTHGAMCGNGGRAAVLYAKHVGELQKAKDISFGMAGEVYEADILDNGLIQIAFPPPKSFEDDLELDIDGRIIKAGYVDVGSQHAVINYDELQLGYAFRDFNINQIGRAVRTHPKFGVSGANANFYTIIDDVVHLRTYERGVEAETGACGTGAISTAVITTLRHNLDCPVSVIPPSGEKLLVNIINKINDTQKIQLIGPAVIIDEKTIEI